jgi:hypothetical protein
MVSSSIQSLLLPRTVVVVVVRVEKSNRKLANFCLLVRYAVKSNG